MSHTPPTSYSPMTLQSGFSSSASMAERNDLHDMSPEELELECQHLRDENHQLQLRILGVNELARLLQDRSELVQVLEEKNKRLEIAVVRLENRCANYDRTLKSQKGANVPTAKPGQSPFIPGPSRQILEGLMKENSDLKKTVSSLTGKGAAGYLEAVKATQLEEVIDQQKQEIEFLKDQINQLTSTGFIEEKTEGTTGQLSSLPANVSDSGPLKRQLIQLQRAMKVKDRFCTLLSQQVAQLQNRLSSLEFQDGESSSESTTGPPQQESSGHEAVIPQVHKKTVSNDDQGDSAYKKLYEEANETLAKERDERLTLVEKMSSTESELKEKRKIIDKLEQRCEELTSYHQTLLMEKSELNQMLSETHQKMESLSISGSEGGSPRRSGPTTEHNAEQLQKELKKSEDQINDLRAQLEEANVRTAIADSKLNEIESKHAQQLREYNNLLTDKSQEVRKYQEKVQQNETQLSDLHDRVSDLEEELQFKDNQYSNLLRDITEDKHTSRSTGITSSQLRSMAGVRSGGAPSLFTIDSHVGPDDVTVKDYAGTPQQPQRMRNPTVQTSLLARDVPEGQHQKQPPTNLGLHGTSQQPGRVSPGFHHMTQPQYIQAKGQPHPQPNPQQLQTPATPVAPNQGSYAAIPAHTSYTHPIGQGSSQIMFGGGTVPMSYGQQQRVQGSTIHSRPQTMPITSPSPTPGSSNRMLAGSSSGGTIPTMRAPYTSSHGYPGTTSSSMAQYSQGSGSAIPGSYSSSGYGGGNASYGGGRGMRGPAPYSTAGQSVFGGMSGNTHAGHLYNTGSPYGGTPSQLQHQHSSSGSSGYNSGEMYSSGMSGSASMRPNSPRTYSQQSSTGGYPGPQGGPSGQYSTSPRSYDPSGGYPPGGHGTGGQHNFPPRGPH